jgi:hypothetical protein
MRSSFLTQVVLFSLLLWAGMILGISFLEAPVKFTAPQVTLAIGLGIGRLVFGFLNKFELVFCSAVLMGLIYNQASFKIIFPALLLALVMALQTLWLLPALDVRALQIISGQVPSPSNLHHVYVGMEVFKLGMLLGTASAVFKKLASTSTFHQTALST